MTASQRYRVSGADKHTGEELEIVVDAESADAAAKKANTRGLLVSSCEAVLQSPRAAPPRDVLVAKRAGPTPARRRVRLRMVAVGVAVVVIAVGVVAIVRLKQNHNRSASPSAAHQNQSPALIEFRTALFKMRADLKIELNNAMYLQNLRSLQLAADQIAPADRETPDYRSMRQAFQEYLAAYKCIEIEDSGMKATPPYAAVAAMQKLHDEKSELLTTYKALGFDTTSLESREKYLNLQGEVAMLAVRLPTVLEQAMPAIDAYLLRNAAEKSKHWSDADAVLSSLAN